MNFSTNFTVRTDLAAESLEGLRQKKGEIGDGITFETSNKNGVAIETVVVENDSYEKSLGKPCGKYVTVSTGEITKKSKAEFENAALVLSDIISSMIPKNGLCLVVCLGNDRILADAIGPLSAKSIIVSRHLKLLDKKLFDSLGLRECACIIPGVMGDTGAEAFELVKAAVDSLKPSCVIVIDALCSRAVSRLGKTVQICSCGISPGSGVGNARHEISQKTLGIPTVAIGVPTVVEALTLSLDLLSQALSDETQIYDFIAKRMTEKPEHFFVCPKETDKIVASVAKLLGYSINLAFHKDMTISQMEELLL